jgi:hypothetical protein
MNHPPFLSPEFHVVRCITDMTSEFELLAKLYIFHDKRKRLWTANSSSAFSSATAPYVIKFDAFWIIATTIGTPNDSATDK